MDTNLAAVLRSPRTELVLRVVGALLLLFVGADHYYEYAAEHYSVLPTIGTLFLLHFASATALALVLLAPLSRAVPRFNRAVLQGAALSGFGLAATSLTALLVSEQTTLFGFMEFNYRSAVVVALASEGAAAVVLALLFVVARRRSTSSGVVHGRTAAMSRAH